MTTSRAALTTIPATLSDGTRARIIGRVDAFPGHPDPGTPVEPLTAGTSEPVTDLDGPLFALVSVTWATEVTTVNAHTGASHTKYVPGLLGSPMGTSWYLAMVTPVSTVSPSPAATPPDTAPRPCPTWTASAPPAR
ncbi:hypothetical protein QBL07_024490 (plasmid) [Gordonia rubripertincta]|uniref:hypothetical protein n=1 Tax=Gordonia rubripertincta TaxID=36822 RepID=UPI0039B4FD23